MEQFIQQLPPWVIKAAAFGLGLVIAACLWPLLLKLRRKTIDEQALGRRD